MKNNKALLLKSLPLCPKGRIFKMDLNGDYYHHLTDEETITNQYKFYVFSAEEVENSKDWFEIVKSNK